MWQYCILTTILFSPVVAINPYVVTTPTIIRPGMNMQILVNILRSNGNVTLVTSVTGSQSGVIVSNNRVVRPGRPVTVSLKLPTNLKKQAYYLRVGGRGGIIFSHTRFLRFKETSLAIIIQTDKGIYQPGQSVMFRVFAVYPDLKPYLGTFNVTIYDPRDNKIKTYTDVKGQAGIFSDQMALSPQPVIGRWKIEATAIGQSDSVSVTVEKFVAPKFEVILDVLKHTHISRPVTGTVQARYTFGKRVEGSVLLRVTRNRCGLRSIEKRFPLNRKTSTPFTVTVNQLLPLNVKCSGEPLPIDPTKPPLYALRGVTLRLEAVVTESLTGNTVSEKSHTRYIEHTYRLQWLSTTAGYFKPGLFFDAFLKVTRIDGSPRASRAAGTVTLDIVARTGTVCTGYQDISLPQEKLQIPLDGLIFWSNSLPKNSQVVTFTATYNSAAPARLAVKRMQSRSDNYIKVYPLDQEIEVGKDILFEIAATLPMNKVFYQVISRGVVVKTAESDAGNKTTLFESVIITNKMAPSSRLFVYTFLDNGELLADGIYFFVKGIYDNQVSITLSHPKAKPGQGLRVNVKCDVNSTVNLMAIDQSILLLDEGNDVTQDRVEEKISSFGENRAITSKQFASFGYAISFGGIDVPSIVRNSGITMISNSPKFVKKPCTCCYVTTTTTTRRLAGTTRRPPTTPKRFGGWGGGGGRAGRPAPRRPAPTPAPAPAPTPAPKPFLRSKDEPEIDDFIELEDPIRVRTLFPDTWIWANQTTGSDGWAIFPATVPDTITSWVTSAFAINPVTGLGVAPTNPKIEGFKSFFVTLDLPASVVRGEELVIQAIVFNYLRADTTVEVILSKSNEFLNIDVDSSGQTITSSGNRTERIRVSAGDAEVVFFPIIPTALGNIELTVTARSKFAADALTRHLLVEPEGVLQEYNLPVLVTLTTASPNYSQLFPLPLPNNVVPGSVHVNAYIHGDTLAPTIQNLDRLLRMPGGCGEQNMLKFAPDVFIMQYLKKTNQLTADIREKATRFLELGYQRELTYQRMDGSFSAFGDKDKSGSMWLTAFVVTTFCAAKPFTYIDDKVINRAVDWIVAHQGRSGDFPEPGRVIHRNMQGGSASGTALTAYVLAAISPKETLALQPSKRQQRLAAISRAKRFLEGQVLRLTEIYSLSIVSYTLKLSNSRLANRAYARLLSQATVQAQEKFWSAADGQQILAKGQNFWTPPVITRSQDVEATAYVLLILTRDENIAGGLPVNKWIAQQRNHLGGFSSTQDTVMGLQALSAFACLIFSNTTSVNVNVATLNRNFSQSFHISRSNNLVVQSAEIPGPPNLVQVSANGRGLCVVDVAVVYNVFQDSRQPAFNVSFALGNETINGFGLITCATMDVSQFGSCQCYALECFCRGINADLCCSQDKEWEITMYAAVAGRQYNSTRGSGMVVQEIGTPTGFQCDLDSIGKVDGLKRRELLDRKVVLYFDEMSSAPVCVRMKVDRVGLVAKSQAVPIRVYQYYTPNEQATVFYESQLLKNSTACGICLDCRCSSRKR